MIIAFEVYKPEPVFPVNKDADEHDSANKSSQYNTNGDGHNKTCTTRGDTLSYELRRTIYRCFSFTLWGTGDYVGYAPLSNQEKRCLQSSKI